MAALTTFTMDRSSVVSVEAAIFDVSTPLDRLHPTPAAFGRRNYVAVATVGDQIRFLGGNT